MDPLYLTALPAEERAKGCRGPKVMFRKIRSRIFPRSPPKSPLIPLIPPLPGSPLILTLPNELFFIIASLLHCKDIYSLLSTNRRLAFLLINTLYDEAIKNWKEDKIGDILCKASEAGHENVVLHLLDRGIPATRRGGSNTPPFNLAASAGHAGVIRILMSRIQNAAEHASKPMHDWGRTPMQEAILHGHTEAVKAMLEGGADPNALIRPGSIGFIPMQLAAEGGYEEIIGLLLEYGAKIDLQKIDRFEKSILHCALMGCYRTMQRPNYGGMERVVRMLLANGADASAVDPQGYSALYWLCGLYKGGWATKISSGEELEREEALIRTFGNILLENGANINAKDRSGMTPLHHAALFKNPHIIRVLVELGANVNALTLKRETPLHFALDFGRHEVTGHSVARVLLELGADRSIKDLDGCTFYDTTLLYRKKGNKLAWDL